MCCRMGIPANLRGFRADLRIDQGAVPEILLDRIDFPADASLFVSVLVFHLALETCPFSPLMRDPGMCFDFYPVLGRLSASQVLELTNGGLGYYNTLHEPAGFA